MKTLMQDIIQWIEAKKTTIISQDGTKYIAIDYEEIKAKFDEWKIKEMNQIIDLNISIIKSGLYGEGKLLSKSDELIFKDRLSKLFNKHF